MPNELDDLLGKLVDEIASLKERVIELETNEQKYLSNLKIGSRLFINDDANTKQTIGLTINQGAADDEIVSLKSSDVSHGMTGLTEDDTFAFLLKAVAASGGIEVIGLSEGNVAINLLGMVTSPDTTKSGSGIGPLIFEVGKKSGTGGGALGADENALVIRNWGTTKFIFDADGDFWLSRNLIADGSIGIGTTNPLAKLVVSNGGAGGIELTPSVTLDGLTGGYIASYDRNSNAYQPFMFDAGDKDYQFRGSGDFYSAPWQNYGASSTIGGFSVIIVRDIYYKKIGKLVFVNFYIRGTSNSDSLYFTLPFTSASTMATIFSLGCESNSAWQAAHGSGQLGGSSATVYTYINVIGTGFAATNEKAVQGQFFYQIA